MAAKKCPSDSYRAFIAAKWTANQPACIDGADISERLFAYQRAVVAFALRIGRSAVFLADAEASGHAPTLFDAMRA